LRESLYAARDKRGLQRRDVAVEACFAPLLRWVLSLWQSDDRVLFLAVDATTLRQTFTVLSISVLVSDLAPAEVSPTWYTLRWWIETGFKALKTAGFHWERTRMVKPRPRRTPLVGDGAVLPPSRHPLLHTRRCPCLSSSPCPTQSLPSRLPFPLLLPSKF